MRRRRNESPGKRKYEALYKEITGEMDIQRISAEEVAKALGNSRATVYRKLNNPGELRLDELLKLCSFLGFPIEKTRAFLHYK